jgi:hypothetical protein
MLNRWMRGNERKTDAAWLQELAGYFQEHEMLEGI